MPTPGARPEPGRRAGAARERGLLWTLAVIAAGVLAVDLATKQIVLGALDENDVVPLLGDLLSLRLVRNPGAAFSLASGTTWVFTVIAVAVIVVVARVARRLGSPGWAVALGMLLGGAAGNLVDRLVRPPGVGRGHVIDFIDYAGLFVGNIADIAIVGASALIVVLSLRGIGLDGSRPGTAAPGEETPDA